MLFKSASLFFVVCLCILTGIPALAASVESTSTQATLENSSAQFANMTNDELNDFIDNIAKASTTSAESSKSGGITISSSTLEQAWLAAAQIARNNGYPCAATLVECSVRNYPFTEGVSNNYDSLFATLVNNWAWLCQQTYVLNPIPVTINFLD